MAEIAGFINITGTAKGSPLKSYKLEYRPVGGTTWTTAFSGSGSVIAGNLGTFDPTMALGGQTELRLTACDIYGYCADATRTVVLVGQQKVGVLSLAFNDLQLSLGGLPITVQRSYDSRDKDVGDFGVGWRLGLSRMKVQTNGPLGSDWTNTRSNCSFLQVPTYCITESRPHRVTVTRRSADRTGGGL
jgi:hypothetical protein